MCHCNRKLGLVFANAVVLNDASEPSCSLLPVPWVLWGGNAGAVLAAATSTLVRPQQTPPNYLQRKQEAP